MSVISMKQLLEAGVHFGHQTRRWNPKMAEYIYTERNGIYIIDLQKSVGMVDDAYNAIKDIVADGGTILFVGTKKQAQDAIRTEAERCGMFYVNQRWLGGMLTNFKTIQSRVQRLKEIEKMAEDGTFDVLPKKEVIALKKEWEKLENGYGLPDIHNADSIMAGFTCKPDTMTETKFEELRKYIEPIMVYAGFDDKGQALTFSINIPFTTKDMRNEVKAIIKQKSFKWSNGFFKEC